MRIVCVAPAMMLTPELDADETGTECFGWAVEEALEGPHLRPIPEACRHHHRSQTGWLRRDDMKDSGKRWSWWPTWSEFSSHYFREIGFLASLAQTIGATVFWISGFTALAPINSVLSVPVANVIYWLPQVVGGAGFIVSSVLYMLEVQDKWYRPAPELLGWQVGFWNLIGAIGFTLCGALGFAATAGPNIEYALALSSFVGSWAFMVCLARTGSGRTWLTLYFVLLDRIRGTVVRITR